MATSQWEDQSSSTQSTSSCLYCRTDQVCNTTHMHTHTRICTHAHTLCNCYIIILCYHRKYADGVNKMRNVLHETLSFVLTQDVQLVTLTGAVQIISFLGPQVGSYDNWLVTSLSENCCITAYYDMLYWLKHYNKCFKRFYILRNYVSWGQYSTN